MTIVSKNAIHPQSRTIDGVSIRLPRASPATTTPCSPAHGQRALYAYEAMWTRLAEHAQLVAIDLPGFGRSERRNELMSPAGDG